MSIWTDDMDQLVESLPGISLQGLVSQAALLARVDHKYLLDRELATQVLRQVAPQAQALEIDGSRSFGYHTAYFDLPTLDCFYATAHRRRKRFKVRVRDYCDSGQSWLEVKTRTGGRLTIKDRLEVDPGLTDARYLPSFAVSYVEEILDLRLGQSFDLAELRNTMTTNYRRSTLLLPAAHERITLDENLTVALPGGESLLLGNQVVMETKSGSGRSAIDHVLWRRGARPRSISKYATGLALLDPSLPRNRWARTIAHMRAEQPSLALVG